MYQNNPRNVSYAMLASVSFHALMAFFFVYFFVVRQDSRTIVLNNVDLIMQEKEEQAKAPAQNKTMSFLKLALPQIPKIAAPEIPKIPQFDIKTPDRQRAALDLPKSLSERSGRVTADRVEVTCGSNAIASNVSRLPGYASSGRSRDSSRSGHHDHVLPFEMT